MTQTILIASLSLDGLAAAATVRPEEPIGHGQSSVDVVGDEVHAVDGAQPA